MDVPPREQNNSTSEAARRVGIAARALRQARRLIVFVVGITVLAVGAAMIILPGPAVVVIPIGLGILATEFVWARRLLNTMKERGQALIARARQRAGEKNEAPH